MRIIRPLSAVAALFLSVLPVIGQTRNYGELRPWDKGPLTVEDFKLINVSKEMDFRSSYIDVSYGRSYQKKRAGNLRYKAVQLHTLMDPLGSWIDAGKYNEDVIRYNQVIFDIAESVRMDYQKAIDQSGDQKDTVEYYNRLARSRVETFNLESGFGCDGVVVGLYGERLKSELEQKKSDSEDVRSVPPTFKKLDEVNYCLGYEGRALTGQLAQYFPYMQGIRIGVDFWYHKFIFGFDMSAYFPRTPLKAGIVDKDGYSWLEDLSGMLSWMGVKVGYSIIDGPWFSLSPFVGLGDDSFSQAKPEVLRFNEKDTSSKIGGLGFQGGADLSFKFSRALSSVAPIGFEHSVLLRLYASRSDYMPMGTCWAFNFGISYCFGMIDIVYGNK